MCMAAYDNIGLPGFRILGGFGTNQFDAAEKSLTAAFGPGRQSPTHPLHVEVEPVNDIGDDGMIGQESIPGVAMNAQDMLAARIEHVFWNEVCANKVGYGFGVEIMIAPNPHQFQIIGEFSQPGEHSPVLLG